MTAVVQGAAVLRAETGRQQARPLGATAHPVNELVPGNAVRLEDSRGEVQVNGIGQNSQGLFGEFGEAYPAQHVNYILPGTLHGIAQLSLA
jgi:hypothetical protein